MSVPDSQPANVILVADDDDDMRRLVTFRLEHSGFTVLQAKDGEEAYRLAAEERPDLAVLDVGMPKLDGVEVVRRLRADAATQAMPIILLTAWVQEADVQRGFAAGASDYMKKPFSPMELVARVQTHLARR
ncbi:MAG TPA: response regulator [Gaiellaceae bacterium]|jgi:DNA-binding response OmpR family regulator|nr:response regulator [Gaiellaceae bacterium]